MRSTILLLFGFLMFNNTYAQNTFITNTFRSPLDIPLFLSGNFAELRADHFHSGIDLKTQGVTGKKVHAIEDGYVSRIKIQTNGYGHSLYITYPGGYTSLYGHLSAYNDTIAGYVKAYQYRNHVFEVDIYPSPGDIPVKKGEVVAYSGNTGSSGGPHLHFEIRHTGDQHPLNVLRYGFDIRDNIPPHLYSLFVYGMQGKTNDRTGVSRKEYDLSEENGTYQLKNTPVITTTEPVGLGIECYDFMNGTTNRCAVYSIELQVNHEPVYHYLSDEFSFNESRYVNAHVDYSLEMLTKRKVHDLYRKPGEHLSMDKLSLNDGIISPAQGETEDISILVTDAYGNASTLNFKLQGAAKSMMTQKIPNDDAPLFKWYDPNYFSNELIRLSIPANALYENTYFHYSRENSATNIYPYIHRIHSDEVPLQKYALLSILASDIPDSLAGKTGIVLLPRKGDPVWVGGTVKNGWITAPVNAFGNFTLEADTVPPVIIPLNISQNKDMRSQRSVRFTIRDQLSGISSYEGYIDNTWVLFEYDPKFDLLFYVFDPDRLKSGISHELELYIKDAAGNPAVYHSTFFR